jgi:hypothetical protein
LLLVHTHTLRHQVIPARKLLPRISCPARNIIKRCNAAAAVCKRSQLDTAGAGAALLLRERQMCKIASPVNVSENVVIEKNVDTSWITHLRHKRRFAPALRDRVERVEGGLRADAGNARCA